MTSSSMNQTAILPLQSQSSPTLDGIPTEIRGRTFKWLFSGETVAARLFDPSTRARCRDHKLKNWELAEHTKTCIHCRPFKASTVYNILLTCCKYHDEAIDIYVSTTQLDLLVCCVGGSHVFKGSELWPTFRAVTVKVGCSRLFQLEDTLKCLTDASEVQIEVKNYIMFRGFVTRQKGIRQSLVDAFPLTRKPDPFLSFGLGGGPKSTFFAIRDMSVVQQLSSNGQVEVTFDIKQHTGAGDYALEDAIIKWIFSDSTSPQPEGIYETPFGSRSRESVVGKACLDMGTGMLRCYLRGKVYHIKVPSIVNNFGSA